MSDKFKLYAKVTGLTLGAIFSATLFLLYFKQNKLIYHPKLPVLRPSENPRSYRHPGERNMKYKDIEAISQDGTKIRGWFIHQDKAIKSPTIVFMHENAGNIG